MVVKAPLLNDLRNQLNQLLINPCVNTESHHLINHNDAFIKTQLSKIYNK